VKQAFFAFLIIVAVPSFSQTRQDTFVYIVDITDGTAEERRFFEDNLGMEISAAGYTLTGDILNADYALSCSIQDDEDGAGRLLACSLVDTKNERELVSTALGYDRVEETYEMLPYIIWSMFANASLKQQEPEKEIVEIEKEVPVYIEVVREVEKPVLPEQTEPSGDWKRRRVFLNLRAGLSSRYYRAAGDAAPIASTLTFDAGVESELHLFDFLAVQLGLGFSLDQAEYRRSPSDPSPLTTLGPYLGPYATIPLLGTTTPPPLGLLGGLDLSVKTGIGIILFDLRCAVDLGSTGVVDGALDYHRMFITLSAGYKFGFLRKRG
jgi:hypothetical protein